ncbi:hypothetical protein [Mycolicibacterium gilvum]|uniref:hypothetical protein n=1 Tax=Mycolicibacterium gilvum TaxID=1804 RepID=UPI00404557AD
MGQYVIVEPCVVAGRHYVRPTVEDFDDDAAAPLVKSGSLKPYRAEGESRREVVPAPNPYEGIGDVAAELTDYAEAAQKAVPSDDEPPTDPPPPRRSRGKRSGG